MKDYSLENFTFTSTKTKQQHIANELPTYRAAAHHKPFHDFSNTMPVVKFSSGGLDFQKLSQIPKLLQSPNLNLVLNESIQVPNVPMKIPTLCVSLLPQSLKQLIGRCYISSSNVYLLMIEWSVDWFAEYEKALEPNQCSPPILSDNTEFDCVCKTFRDEIHYYNIYFKLLLLESWYKMYTSWKSLRSHSPVKFVGKICDFERKNDYNKYVIEFFDLTINKEQRLKDCYVVLIRFTTSKNASVTMLGYVVQVKHRKYDSLFDSNHEGFKLLNVPNATCDEVIKYKVTIYTVFKSDDVNVRELVYVKKLVNIRKILIQNDALQSLSKSRLCQAIIEPITSPYKISISLTHNIDNDLNYVCERIVDDYPLLATISSKERENTLVSLIDKLHTIRPKSKIILCSKYIYTLAGLAAVLQNYKLIFINKDNLKSLESISVRQLSVEMAEYNENYPSFLKEYDIILVLLLGLHDPIARLTCDLHISCVILEDAHHCSEPESVVPLMFGTNKYVLMGNKDALCRVSPITANYDYNKSLFNRVQ